MKEAVCFAYAKDQLPVDSRLPDRPELFAELAFRDLRPVITLGGEAAFQGDSVLVSGLVDQEVSKVDELPLTSVGVLVNRLDRSIKKDILTDTNLPPMINENAVRRIAFHKERVASEVLDPLGYGIATTLVACSEDVTHFIEANRYDNYFLKPRHGKFGNGTQVLGAKALQNYFSENPGSYDKYILQPAFDFSSAFPHSMKPFDADTNEAYKQLSVAGTSKELRMYGFLSPQGTSVFPAARAVDISSDERKHTSTWFFVDPETIPPAVVEESRAIIQRTAALTGSIALYGAVDFGYGTPDSSDPDWHVIELNALAPGMIGNKENKTVATTLRTLFADQIQSTVESMA